MILDNNMPTNAPVGPTMAMLQTGIHKKLSTPVDPWLADTTKVQTYSPNAATAISQPHAAARRPVRNISQTTITGTRLQTRRPAANSGSERTSYATANAGTHAPIKAG